MVKKRDRASKKWVIATLVVFVIVIFLVLISVVFYNKKHTTTSIVDTRAAAVQLQQKDTVGGKGSPKYNNDLMELGDKEAVEAKQRGKDYIPPVVQYIEKKALSDKDIEEPKAEPVVIANTKETPMPAVVKTQTNEPTDRREPNPREEILKNSILAELVQITGKLKAGSPQTTVFASLKDTPPSEITGESSTGRGYPEEPTKRDIMALLGVRPGDVFYAVNGETLNSDAPAPVGTAKILSGKLKDARVIGSFVRENEYLIFKYSSMTTADGKHYIIEGFAVDPQTQSAGVRSDVDNHYLSRWGGLVASSFLEGFGKAVSSSNTSSLNPALTNGTIITNTPAYSTGEQAWIAAGKVGEKVGEKTGQNFDRAPTVTLNQNTPIGVLILNIEERK